MDGVRSEGLSQTAAVDMVYRTLVLHWMEEHFVVAGLHNDGHLSVFDPVCGIYSLESLEDPNIGDICLAGRFSLPALTLRY